MKTRSKVWIGLLIVGALAVIGGGVLFAEVQNTISATKKYNQAVVEYNARVEEYQQAVALTCIDNISGLPTTFDFLSTESEEFIDNAKVVLGSNNKDKIAADTKTVYEMAEQVEAAGSIVRQITAPTEEWVMSRLRLVDAVRETQAVTKSFDPDGLLGKKGGFSACIYFTITEINPDDVVGDNIVAKGTDAGGAVEVYPTLADAEARCAYLAGFDGTILYSGSYAIVGTMVIRTSYKLTDEQQFNLTNDITEALTQYK